MPYRNDPVARVRAHALRGLALEAQALQQAYARAPSDAVRRQLLHGSRLLGKWETLGFLLPLVESAESALAVAEIERWHRTSIRRFTALDPTLRLALTASLMSLQESVPNPRWAHLLDVVRRS